MAIFHPTTEKEVTRAIFSSFSRHLSDCVESEVIIVGSGPSGLVAGREMARAGLRVLIIERNNCPGGGFWIGGYFMNKLTLRAPAQELLGELGVPFEEASPGLYVADAIHACSRLVAAACDAGARFLNLTLLEDVVVREGGRVSGVVINWSPVVYLPEEMRALDPVPLESKLVVDATGHDAVVTRKLEKRGLLKLGIEGPLWIERSEDAIVEHTGEVHPGLVVTGMAVASVYGLPRMGPTFGAMLLSGKRAAQVCSELLKTAT